MSAADARFRVAVRAWLEALVRPVPVELAAVLGDEDAEALRRAAADVLFEDVVVAIWEALVEAGEA